MKRIYFKDKAEIESLLKKNHVLWEDSLYGDVEKIVKTVKEDGYNGVATLTERFDGILLEESEFKVSEAEIKEAFSKVDDLFIESTKKAIDNVRNYHQQQMLNSNLDAKENGVIVGQLIRPLDRVGLYVPGGTAAYPSSVIMTAIPGKVAGVESLVMISPPDKTGKMNPYTLVAASLCGVDEIFKVGGAHGVAALAFGAGPLKKVDKIVGPGNIYVTIAKKIVYGVVDIDMLAGPSEILVIADEGANPEFIAADLLSQGEHDVRAAAVLVTFKESFAQKVEEALERQLKSLSREKIAREALSKRGAIILVDNLEEAIDFANAYAPEHLELAIEKPFESFGAIKNAGAIFLGYYTPEPVGDYFAGPNHVLPTSGTGRFYSPLNTHTYLKKTSIIHYTEEALNNDGKYIRCLAEAEGLEAHSNAVAVRMGKNENK